MLGDMIGHNSGYCDAFNIGQNCGESAGPNCRLSQCSSAPIPKGDMDDPKRRSATRYNEKGNYRLWPADAEDLPNWKMHRLACTY